MKRTRVQVVEAPECAWSNKYMVVVECEGRWYFCYTTNNVLDAMLRAADYDGEVYETDDCEPNYEWEEEW